MDELEWDGVQTGQMDGFMCKKKWHVQPLWTLKVTSVGFSENTYENVKKQR